MKQLLLIIALLPFAAIAQDSSSSKWSIGVNASVDYNYRALFVNTPNYAADNIIFMRNGMEVHF